MLHDNTPLADVEFVAFDLETTGLLAAADRIVEIGAVRFRLDGTELDSFEQLVDPECDISAQVTRIHGITNQMVWGNPTISAVLPQFVAFLGGPDAVLLAHNAAFDLGFLGFAMAKLGTRLPTHRIVDTLSLAQNCVRASPTYKLEDLAVYFGVAESEDHRGLSDSRLVARVFCRIVSRTRRLQTVRELMRLSRSMSFRDTVIEPSDLAPGLECLSEAIEGHRPVLLVYDGGTRGTVERRVTPHGIVTSGGRSYLRAYCHRDGIDKSFRIERILHLRVESR